MKRKKSGKKQESVYYKNIFVYFLFFLKAPMKNKKVSDKEKEWEENGRKR